MSPRFALPASCLAIALLGMICGCASASAANAQSSTEGTRLLLLGTAGGPGAMPNRSGIASIVKVGDDLFLVDAGDGVTKQLALAGLKEADIDKVFLTHLHDDHTVGLPALASFSYTLRGKPMTIFGPPETEKLVRGLLAFLQPNADIRGQERRLPEPASRIVGRNVPTGVVWSDSRVRVIAAENSHFHLAPGGSGSAYKSYAYRFETPGKTIVFTGDSGPSEAVAALAKGADILVSEMVSEADLASVPREIVPHMLTEHLSPAELGKLAAAAGVRKVIISHSRSVGESDLRELRREFRGDVVIGQDLDQH